MTMMTFLPPISRWTFLNAGRRAWFDDPADVGRAGERDDAHVGRASSAASPTSSPPPVTRLTTPGGTPASSSTLTKLSAESGVSDAGLKTTVLPQTSAGMIFHDGIAIGKFHGVMIDADAERLADRHRELVAQLGRHGLAEHAAALRRP